MEAITATRDDATRLPANALLGTGDVPAPEPVVPELTSLGLMAAGLAALGLVAQKRKQH